MSLFFYDDASNAERYIGMFFDITERMHLEQLRQDMLAIASHDLRNPLAVISMRSQLLQRRQTHDETAVRGIWDRRQHPGGGVAPAFRALSASRRNGDT